MLRILVGSNILDVVSGEVAIVDVIVGAFGIAIGA